jgi:hypothetical protein
MNHYDIKYIIFLTGQTQYHNSQTWITGMLSKPLVRAVEQQRSSAVEQ